MATIKSIEEKARRYDEAIKTARKINSGEGVAAPPDWTICEVIFPELKESEDERIRKEMIETLKNEAHEFPSSIIAEKSKSWIAWLEKKGEHANFRNKIQIGDKVTRNEDGVLVNLSQLKRVAKKQSEQKTINGITKEVCKNKASAVAFLKSTGIMNENGELADEYKIEQGEQKPNFCHHEVDLSGCSEEYCKAYYDGWNNCNQQHAQLEAEQKSVEWSEEDEKHLNRAINILDASKTYTTSPEKYEETINWLKFLKDRYTWKPSNEQMNALSVAVKHGQTDDQDALKKLLEQLKKHYL